MGVAAYSELAGMQGMEDTAARYMAKAREMASAWIEKADDGDHYRLAFDRPDTWSLKYNMVWDKLWGTGVFPEDVMAKEIPYYLAKRNRYGVPLDCMPIQFRARSVIAGHWMPVLMMKTSGLIEEWL